MADIPEELTNDSNLSLLGDCLNPFSEITGPHNTNDEITVTWTIPIGSPTFVPGLFACSCRNTPTF
ncbi:hypothetical protein COLO4_15636 [Corchorus olitorius]|uniref:Uncharacterized protein n=1 Tax=Corchorus olitorius TaxID=93759 RepID=A0A1R3JM22_9ROSI|nr:hypothetical protein COLO4_15636 [Corchorus olitorius]